MMMRMGFLKGVMWGSFLAGAGVIYLIAQDQGRRRRVMEVGEQIKNVVQDMARELMRESKSAMPEMETAIKGDISQRIGELEQQVKQLGEKVRH